MNTEDNFLITSHMRELHNACLRNAKNLLSASKRILNEEKCPSIAYHLAVLSLEEIGKSNLAMIQEIQKNQDETSKPIDDHVKKLFWAIWGPSFFGATQLITKQQVEYNQNLATSIHETRLRAMYVDIADGEIISPEDVISHGEALHLIKIVELRLEMEQDGEVKTPIDDEVKSLITWFLSVSNDEEKRRYIFSPASMQELVNIGSLKGWMFWIKKAFDDAEIENQKWLNEEINAVKLIRTEDSKPKWEISIRLHSDIHTIRNSALNSWNNKCDWIKLYATGKSKKDFIAKFTFNSILPANGIWHTGWLSARMFSLALSIGSLGFIWWYQSSKESASRFYEKLIDLENKKQFIIERTPILKLSDDRTLSEEDIERTILCFVFFTKMSEHQFEPFNHYLTALALYSKSDIHLQFETQVFSEFWKCIKKLFIDFNYIDSTSDPLDHIKEFVFELTNDNEEQELIYSLCKSIENHTSKPGDITLEEVVKLKVYTDYLIIQNFRKTRHTLS